MAGGHEELLLLAARASDRQHRRAGQTAKVHLGERAAHGGAVAIDHERRWLAESGKNRLDLIQDVSQLGRRRRVRRALRQRGDDRLCARTSTDTQRSASARGSISMPTDTKKMATNKSRTGCTSDSTTRDSPDSATPSSESVLSDAWPASRAGRATESYHWSCSTTTDRGIVKRSRCPLRPPPLRRSHAFRAARPRPDPDRRGPTLGIALACARQ